MSEAKLPPKVFISYRRDDTSAYAGRLSENLGNYFGVDQIFMDVFSIEVGDEFPEAIEKAVTDCDLLLAVIGKQWLSSPRWSPKTGHVGSLENRPYRSSRSGR
jgi:hypothetical protein